MKSWLTLFRRRDTAPPPQEDRAAECPHMILMPRWDSVADIGHEDRVVGYRCDACGTVLTPEEARHRHAIVL